MPSLNDAMGGSVADLILRIVADVAEYEKEMKKAGETIDKTASDGEKRIAKYADEAESSLKKVIHRMSDMDSAVEGITSRLNKLGVNYLKTAAIMAGPFVAAMVKVRNTNQEVALHFSRIDDSLDAVANTMADVAIPYVEVFANGMESLGEKIQSASPFLKNLIGKLIVFRAVIISIKAGLTFLLAGFVKFIWAVTKFALTVSAVNLVATFFRTAAGAKFLHMAFSALTFIILRLGWAVGYAMGFIIKLPFILMKMVWATAALIPKMLLLVKTLIVGVALGFKTALAAAIGFFTALGPVGWVLIALGAVIAAFAVAWIANWGNIRQATEDVLVWIGDALDVAIDFWMAKLNWLKVEATRTFQFWKNILKGPTEAMRIANEEAENLAKSLSENFEKSKLDLVAFANTVSQKVVGISEKVKTIWANMFAGDKNKTFRQMGAGFTNGLNQMLKEYSDWGATMKNLAIEFAGAMKSAFSEFFFDAFSGKMKTAEEYFANFGEAIIRMIANVVAQLVAMWLIVMAISALPGGSAVLELLGFAKGSTWNKHEGGEIKHEGGGIGAFGMAVVAHEGMSVDERMVKAQVGEGVLSRNGMATVGGAENLNKLNAGNGSVGGSPIYLIQNIKSWDAADVIRNKKALASGMIEEIMNNGALRGTIKRYT